MECEGKPGGDRRRPEKRPMAEEDGRMFGDLAHDRSLTGWAGEVHRLAVEQDAVILAHNYQILPIQDEADHVEDSLELARLAAEGPESTVVVCGVRFMAETAKLLAPGRARAPTRTRGRLLAGRLDHSPPPAGLEAAPSRRRGGDIREHLGGGEGRSRLLLHFGQCRSSRGSDPA